jgi:hypothetical protein
MRSAIRLRSSSATALRTVKIIVPVGAAVFDGDTTQVRAWLSKQIDQILAHPDGGIYVASGSWSLLGVGRWDGAEGQNRTAYAGLFRAALYR